MPQTTEPTCSAALAPQLESPPGTGRENPLRRNEERACVPQIRTDEVPPHQKKKKEQVTQNTIFANINFLKECMITLLKAKAYLSSLEMRHFLQIQIIAASASMRVRGRQEVRLK